MLDRQQQPATPHTVETNLWGCTVCLLSTVVPWELAGPISL